MRSACFLGLVFLASLGVAQVTCPPAGLVLTTTPPRLGDPWSLAISGSPNAPGLLGFDLAPGPVATPFGTVCLGLTPAFQWNPISLDAFGGYATSGFLPANPALSGFGVFMQAAVADPAQPSGIALSNSVHAVLRAPRVFFIDPGTYATPPAGRWLLYDALTDSAGPVVTLPSDVIQAVAVPALGWIAMILGNGNLMTFDALTGAVTMTVPLTAPGNGVVLKVSGSTVLVLEYTIPGPNILHFVNLSLAAPPVSVPLPMNTWELIVHSESGTVYTIGAWSGLVFPYSIASATQLPPISIAAGVGFGVSTGTWAVHGATIYFLMNLGASMPCGITAIDTSTNLPLVPAPVPVPYVSLFLVDPLLRFGPGASGPSLFIRDNVSGPGNTVVEISPQTFAVTSGPIPIPPDVNSMELSRGGTEWLLASCQGCAAGGCPGGGNCGGSPQTLYRMDATSHAVTTVGPLPNGIWAKPIVLPSGSLNKAFVSTGGGVVRFDTDPTTSIIPVPLPIAVPVNSVGLKVVID